MRAQRHRLPQRAGKSHSAHPGNGLILLERRRELWLFCRSSRSVAENGIADRVPA
jgi:hypothetical protein